jgi:hypothetical protein
MSAWRPDASLWWAACRESTWSYIEIVPSAVVVLLIAGALQVRSHQAAGAPVALDLAVAGVAEAGAGAR